MRDPAERSEAAAYIEQRLRTLERAEPAYQRKTFSFEDPHTCPHCRDVFLTVDSRPSEAYCINCYWFGVGELSTDGRHRLCGQCGRPRDSDEHRDYSVELGYSLEESIAASKEGCALYGWLVDKVALKISTQEDWQASHVLHFTAYKFHLQGRSSTSSNLTPTIRVVFTPAESSTTGAGPETIYLDWPDNLEAWTLAADPASRYIVGRPYERNVKSANSMKFARDCFQECLGNHDRCLTLLTDGADREDRVPGPILRETVDITHVPSRLIYIRPEVDPAYVSLIETRSVLDETKADITRSGFAVLSYCWGGDQALTLTMASYGHLKGGLPVSSLPQTFQDTVWVMRELEIRYVWIDALCIFQDSNEDKGREIPRMATYYSRAILTICAAAAPRSAQGFLDVHPRVTVGSGPSSVSISK